MPSMTERAVLDFKINGYFFLQLELTVNGTARKRWNVPSLKIQDKLKQENLQFSQN